MKECAAPFPSSSRTRTRQTPEPERPCASGSSATFARSKLERVSLERVEHSASDETISLSDGAADTLRYSFSVCNVARVPDTRFYVVPCRCQRVGGGKWIGVGVGHAQSPR